MSLEKINSQYKRPANHRLCNLSSYTTELLEIEAEIPKSHVLLIPGNPGVVFFYKDFVESLYELLDGNVSVTVIGHLSHTQKNWKTGKMFSLEEEIEHKVDFIKHELENVGVPLVLVGHSIGSYIAFELFSRYPEKVLYCVGLYPFMQVNMKSVVQSAIGKIAASSFLSASISSLAGVLGLLPSWVLKFIAKKAVGKSGSATAVEAVTHLLQYQCVRNILFLAMTEFRKLSDSPDWEFMREKQG